MTAFVDASAALGIIERRGLEKVRHIETSHRWIQEAAVNRQVTFSKVKGQQVRADVMAKDLAPADIKRHTIAIGTEFVEGRVVLAACIDAIECIKGEQTHVGEIGSGTHWSTARAGQTSLARSLPDLRVGVGQGMPWIIS